MDTIHGWNLNIAILLDDSQAINSLTKDLRDLNVMTFFYSTLDEMWMGIQGDEVDLVVLDVKLMNQHELMFKNHPLVINKKLQYIFCYQPKMKILINSTQSLSPMGFVNLDLDLGMQLRGIIHQHIEIKKSNLNLQGLEKKCDEAQKKMSRIYEEKAVSDQMYQRLEVLRSKMTHFEELSRTKDFFQSVFELLTTWDLVSQFSLWELNQDCQKLISPTFKNPKYIPMPGIWLGQKHPRGLEYSGLEMASQVANELFEEAPFILRIGSDPKRPQHLILINGSKDFFDFFPWDLFENYLGDMYRRFVLKKSATQVKTKMIPAWEMLERLDKSLDIEFDYFYLNFGPILKTIQEKKHLQFFWKKFFQDFYLHLPFHLGTDSTYSSYGCQGLLLEIPRIQSEATRTRLLLWLKNIPYWTYFSDESEVFASSMQPNLEELKETSSSFLNLIMDVNYLPTKNNRLTLPSSF